MNFFSNLANSIITSMDPNTPFCHTYRCYNSSEKQKMPQNLEEGDKIFLPHSALRELTTRNVQYPMTFSLSNPKHPSNVLHCGVLEFTASSNSCYLPRWMMESLHLKKGQKVCVKNQKLPRGEFVSFKALNDGFLKLSDPRVVLEKKLRSYTCLTKNTAILVVHLDTPYRLLVEELKPADAVVIVETDMLMQFSLPAESQSTTLKPDETASSERALDGVTKSTEFCGSEDAEIVTFGNPEPPRGAENPGIVKRVKSVAGKQLLVEESGGFRYFYELQESTGNRKLMRREEIRENAFEGVGHRL